jgi:hypothetical protein
LIRPFSFDARLRRLLAVLIGMVAFATPAPAQDATGFSTSNLHIAYGWSFREPGIAEDVPKNDFTFENIAAGRWWSSYLFVDVLRSWSDADANAKEVYGEWYPSMSLFRVAGGQPRQGFVRDVMVTVGLNSGTRSTGPSPFAVLPGATVEFNVPGFAFASLGTFLYIDRGQFQGQPHGCRAVTYLVSPSWLVPITLGKARLRFDGFADFTGEHSDCAFQVLTQPQLKIDVSGLWGKEGQVFLGVRWVYWHNKYGIEGLRDNLVLPVFTWVIS